MVSPLVITAIQRRSEPHVTHFRASNRKILFISSEKL